MFNFYKKLIFCLNLLIIAESKITFRNIECNIIDKSFGDFEYCYIKAVNRSFKYVSIKIKLYQLPITEATVNINIMKRANGYKPFLYNVTFNGCKFMRDRRNPLIGYFYKFIEKHTNMNHTCPFNNDLVLEKFSTSLTENLMQKLPLPAGDYAVFVSWFTNKVLRVQVNQHLTQLT